MLRQAQLESLHPHHPVMVWSVVVVVVTAVVSYVLSQVRCPSKTVPLCWRAFHVGRVAARTPRAKTERPQGRPSQEGEGRQVSAVVVGGVRRQSDAERESSAAARSRGAGGNGRLSAHRSPLGGNRRPDRPAVLTSRVEVGLRASGRGEGSSGLPTDGGARSATDALKAPSD